MKFIRASQSLILTLALFALSVSVFSACDSSEKVSTISPVSAGPAVPAAPESLLEISASVMVPEGVGFNGDSTNPGHSADGTSSLVSLQDPGGSGKYQFEAQNQLVFNVGEIVNFTVESETELHTFTVDALGIDVVADAGETVKFNFEFKKAGQYELICIPHKAEGMVSNIIVLE